MAIDDAKLAALRASHGPRVKALAAKGHDFAVRMPTQDEYRAFKKQLLDASLTVYASENLFRACCVHPGAEELDALFSKRRMMVGPLANALVDLAGGEGEAVTNRKGSEALLAKHGDEDAVVISHHGLDFVVRMPSREESIAFDKARADPKTRARATERLFLDCCLEPRGDALASALEAWPFVLDVCAADLLEACGARAEVEVKKA